MATDAIPRPKEPALVPFPTGLPAAAPAPMSDWARVFVAARRYKVLVASVTGAGLPLLSLAGVLPIALVGAGE